MKPQPEDELELFGFYSDRRIYGRIWKGWFPSEDNFHYAYCDGELDPDGLLIWVQGSTAKPYGVERVSEAQAAALLLEKCWPNLTSEGWEMEAATRIIAGIIYGQQKMSVKKAGLPRKMTPEEVVQMKWTMDNIINNVPTGQD